MISPSEFASLAETLYSAVLSDIMDDLGYRNQAMNAAIKPLFTCKMIGRAFPVLAANVYEIPQEPYKLQLEALDALQEHDVFVVNTGSDRAAFWGELISSTTRAKGGVGAIIDGYSRDTEKIIEMKFPVFSRGTYPVDSKGRIDVIAYQVPIVCGGVNVYPRDLIFADADGIVVVPQAIEEDVIAKAIEKAQGETVVRNALQKGMKASEAYRTFGIL